MSAWKILVKRLDDIGGRGPRSLFDDLSLTLAASRAGVLRGRRLGLIACTGRGAKAEWYLTPLGVAWCRGLIEVREPENKRRSGGRRKHVVSASWLKGLTCNSTLDS